MKRYDGVNKISNIQAEHQNTLPAMEALENDGGNHRNGHLRQAYRHIQPDAVQILDLERTAGNESAEGKNHGDVDDVCTE